MITIDWPEYGNRVQQYRRKMRLTQAEAAALFEVSRNYLSQIERGEADVSYAIVARICVRFSLKYPKIRIS